MKRSGAADLPLHLGHVPEWLAQRMAKLGFAITESIITEYGKAAFLSRMYDPFWFQGFGAVMGMDWHSSEITICYGCIEKSYPATFGINGNLYVWREREIFKEMPGLHLRLKVFN